VIHGTWAVVLVALGAAVTLSTTVPYSIRSARNIIRPSWVTWAIWTVTTATAALASIKAQAYAAALVPGIQFFRCVMSLVGILIGMRRDKKRPSWQTHDERDPTSRFEYGCLIGACVAWTVWAITGNPILGIVAAIGTELFAAAPTFKNAWYAKEDVATYAGAFFFALTVVAVLPPPTTLADFIYPLYESTLTGTFTILTLLAPLWNNPVPQTVVAATTGPVTPKAFPPRPEPPRPLPPGPAPRPSSLRPESLRRAVPVTTPKPPLRRAGGRHRRSEGAPVLPWMATEPPAPEPDVETPPNGTLSPGVNGPLPRRVGLPGWSGTDQNH
jgi:hypothetical protein